MVVVEEEEGWCGGSGGGGTWTDSDQSPDSSADEAKDPTLLGGLVPPAMRRSKQDFTTALEHYVAAANLVHKITWPRG